MRGPAGMGDADSASRWAGLHNGFKRIHLANGTAAFDAALFDRGDARGIITAIFEATQPLDQGRGNRLIGNSSKYSAHGFLQPCWGLLAAADGLARGLPSLGCYKTLKMLIFFLV